MVADGALAGLERAAAALVRWSESRHVRAQVARRSGSALSPALLRLLEHFEVVGPMRIKDMAECLGVDISTASLQLRELKREELVVSSADPRDGRSSVIAITDKGQRLLERVSSARRGLLEEIFRDVPADRLAQAAGVLDLVQQHVLAAIAEAGYVVDLNP